MYVLAYSTYEVRRSRERAYVSADGSPWKKAIDRELARSCTGTQYENGGGAAEQSSRCCISARK